VFLPNISELIADGEITLGELYSVGGVATATDGHNSLAMLKRASRRDLANSARPGHRQSGQ